ncbi:MULTISPECIES: MCE family protein [Rhodococcus]|uniref:MCE family protein n=2 Tax=Nocardiaceae TaxID=85025 RepID=UPI000EA867E9|nr:MULTISPECIES: MCE family protein [Rhodococcus]MDI9941325.1 MCE family protein [Rhodococcus sp. IEGM 1351]MDJ0418549.1 MCE family protein [Rhodococcus opacus]QZS56819.1 MCE family protein [Rhodococcus opacus]RKM76554.1 mammalian cell entry protein [Rhodococcus opacus]UZG52820.1 MCE family protein [Rhodococcus opacus]
MNLRRSLAGIVMLGTLLAVSGCRFDGINSLPLPGNANDGPTYTITVELRDAQNLVGNSIVKADNVTVGTVRRVVVDGLIAKAVLDIDDSVDLPRTATARLAQTSVLGAQYLEISAPPNGDTTEKMRDGDVIALENSAEYPSTEQVLSALSLVLNGSGLEQLRTIMAELNGAAGGREQTLNQSLARMETFVDGLDSQRGNIVRAIDSLDRFSRELAGQNTTIATGIDAITPALAVLDEQRVQLTQMLDSMGRFGDRARIVLNSSRDDLLSNLHDLEPTLTELANSGTDLPESLAVAASFPFPVTTADKGMRGDYLNLFLTLDLSAEAINNKILGSIPAGELARAVLPSQAVNPLLAPTQPAPAPLPFAAGAPR